MEWIIVILLIIVSYIVIQVAIDRSINTKLLKENLNVLVEIRNLLKEQNKNL
jgi:hypothetical protein